MAPMSYNLSAVAPGFLASQKREFSKSSLMIARAAGRPSGSHSSESTTYSSSVEQNWQPTSTTSGESTADAVTPAVRDHLVRVYSLLAAGIFAAGLGSAAMFMTPLGKMVPFFVPMIGGLGCLLWLSFKPPKTENGQLALFFAFTTLEGMAIAPIVKFTVVKGVLGSALVLTGAIFVGFSAAAFLSPRASLIKFQGPMFGMLLGMVAISFLNMFYPTAFAHSLILYGGLALFSAFIAVDTQAMIERARCGYGNHVQDAVQMFMNVLNIFIRIAQILGGRD